MNVKILNLAFISVLSISFLIGLEDNASAMREDSDFVGSNKRARETLEDQTVDQTRKDHEDKSPLKNSKVKPTPESLLFGNEESDESSEVVSSLPDFLFDEEEVQKLFSLLTDSDFQEIDRCLSSQNLELMETDSGELLNGPLSLNERTEDTPDDTEFWIPRIHSLEDFSFYFNDDNQ